MFLKLAGALVTIGAATGLGWSAARRVRRRPAALAAFRAALQALESEITYAQTPLPEAVGRVAESADDRLVQDFLSGVGVRTASGAPAETAWREALGEAAATGLLLPRQWAPLAALGGVIGATGRADQVKHLQLAREGLAAREAEAAVEAANLVPVLRYAGFAAGAVIVLLLV